MAINKLLAGERCLIQTVDKKIVLTTHRLIKISFSWLFPRKDAVMLEDIVTWEIKESGKALYLGLSIAMALAACYNEALVLFSGFFLTLYLMMRYRKIHIRTHDAVLVLPLDVVDESSMNVLIDTVRVAQRERLEQLKNSQTVLA
ncbi:hypothetical protein MKJ04_21750 [Pontibacter sp. E15-1]|uniref:hypothetical protein n=1 Tax=Pontibacter sp. E15-1 TaxID=2919918 RepID=UPI001F4F99CD|nr:hypothetical protein [Pontibacter sp. E15-1]MCJ8167481.1 hypothetical protein [Pontibacter sp. E15-1]